MMYFKDTALWMNKYSLKDSKETLKGPENEFCFHENNPFERMIVILDLKETNSPTTCSILQYLL